MSQPTSVQFSLARSAMENSSRTPHLPPAMASDGRSGCGSCHQENPQPALESRAAGTEPEPAPDPFRPGCRGTPPANPRAREGSAGHWKYEMKYPIAPDLAAPTSTWPSGPRCWP